MLIPALLRGRPDAPALMSSGGDALDYGALDAVTSALAGRLRAEGAGPGVPIGVAAGKPLEFLLGALAIWRTGAVLVPLDSRGGAKWVQQIASRAGVLGIVSRATASGELDFARAGYSAPGEVDRRAAMVLFTSGSSGAPKGVVLSEEGIVANVAAILSYLPVAEFPRTAITLPLSYSYALVGQALTTLHAGGTVLLLGDLAFPALQVEAMWRLRASGFSSVPTSFRQIVRIVEELPGDARPSLGYLASAGGMLDAGTAEAIRTAFPAARFFNQYGLTEASPRVCAIEASDPKFAAGSVGRALPGLEVISDAAGELLVRGPSVMLGYLGDVEGTSRVLSSDGWLRTGDAGMVDADGHVFVSGRNDGVVKCAGERVSVEEIAGHLRTATGAEDVCVVAVADAQLGARLVAFVEGGPDQVDALRRIAREELPPAKRPVRIHALAALPRTHNGKFDLGALKALAENG
ncbi:MAG: class I adenylate-forming enzyme family protein [Myxococcaceae bacterium]